MDDWSRLQHAPPDELAQASAWLARIGGVIKAPAVPTCRSLNGGRVIDFVVVDKLIGNGIAACSDMSFPGSPHSPVVVRLDTCESRRQALVLMRPVALPLDKPHGCAIAAPTRADSAALLAASQASYDHSAPIDGAYSAVMKVAEDELCNMAGLIDNDGVALPKAVGRSRGPVYKRVPVVPRMPLHGVARTDDIGLGLCLLANFWSEMAGIISRSAITRTVSVPAAARWDAITGALNRKTGLLAVVAKYDPLK